MAELALTDRHNGDQMTARVGDAIVVALTETGSAGYRWSLVGFDDTVVTLERQEFQRGGAAPGSAGTALWHFRATHEGRTRVELKKARPWESAGTATAFTVTLDVVV